MKKKLSHLRYVIPLLVLLLICPANVFADDISTLNVTVKYGQTEARTILNMINELRSSSTDAWYWNSDDSTKTTLTNLSELKYDYTLEKVAMKRAAEIAMFYSHTRPNGDTTWSCYDEEGVSYTAAAENIAYGQISATAVNTAWREDNDNYAGQGHRRNMLSPDYNSVGIGHVYYNGRNYWVEEFAYKSVDSTATSANDEDTDVDVQIANSKITSLNVTFDQSSYSLCKDATVKSSIQSVAVKINNEATYKKINTLPELSISDSSIAEFSDDSIKGISLGSCNLTATLAGQTCTVPVTVESCEAYYDGGTVSKAASCTETGTILYTCSRCGKTYYEETLATGHSWGAGKITTAATCTTKGVKTYSCTACGETKTEEIAALGHDWNTTKTVDKAATCTTAGSKSTHCKNCNETKDTETIPATGHSWDRGKITSAATCTSKGVKIFTCTACGETKTEEIAALGHIWNTAKTVDKAATCTTAGSKSTHCKNCNETKDVETIPVTGHKTAVKNKKAASYLSTGYSGDTYCTVCGKMISKGKTIAKLTLGVATSLKLKTASKAMTVSFVKAKYISGTQIQYATVKSMAKAKTKNTAAASVKITKLTSKKTYYVRVRSYKKIGTKVVYSKWSSIKTVKIK